jgi:WD40 repeat protein
VGAKKCIKNIFLLCIFAGYAPDVKLWEVKFNKSGGYEKTVRAFELVGHNSGGWMLTLIFIEFFYVSLLHSLGVWDFAFDPDSSHVATVCKDGTWKVFDIKSKFLSCVNIISHIKNVFVNPIKIFLTYLLLKIFSDVN